MPDWTHCTHGDLNQENRQALIALSKNPCSGLTVYAGRFALKPRNINPSAPAVFDDLPALLPPAAQSSFLGRYENTATV